MNRQCYKCGQFKEPGAFYVDRGPRACADGLSRWCRECVRVYNATVRKPRDRARAERNRRLLGLTPCKGKRA